MLDVLAKGLGAQLQPLDHAQVGKQLAGKIFRSCDCGWPVSIAEALEHTRSWIAQEPQLKDARVYEIELKPIHDHGRENRWYYLLQLRTEKDGKSSAHYIAVLFNGKVVPAIAEPASIK